MILGALLCVAAFLTGFGVVAIMRLKDRRTGVIGAAVVLALAALHGAGFHSFALFVASVPLFGLCWYAGHVLGRAAISCHRRS